MISVRKKGGRKPYRELTFVDDYMFCKVLQNDPELCRQLLVVILDKDIRKVELVDVQHVLSVTTEHKSVRFDVYLNDDENTVFDLEMQTLRRPELPRRSRYYQSITDIDHLGAGMDYDELPDTYIIFICMFDPFNSGRARYEFRSLCTEDADIELEDGTRRVFINAKSKREDISPELRALLDYLCGESPSSGLTQYISDSIDRAKENRRWEREYVTFEEKLKEARKEGREEGREEGLEEGIQLGREEGFEEGSEKTQDRMNQMINYLTDQGRFDDLKRAANDAEFRRKIFEEMGA